MKHSLVRSSLEHEDHQFKPDVDAITSEFAHASFFVTGIRIGVAVTALSTTVFGVGLNLLTDKANWPIVASVCTGTVVGLYFAERKSRAALKAKREDMKRAYEGSSWFSNTRKLG